MTRHMTIVMVVLIGMCGACGPQAGSPTPTPTPTSAASDVIIPDTTKVLDDGALAALVSVAQDGTVTFSSSSPVLDGLAPGDVMVAGVAGAAPFGLLRKVESVSAANGRVEVRTIQARLQDAISKGRVTSGASLTPDDVSSSEPLQKGVFRRAAEDAAEDEGIVFGLNDVVVYSDANATVKINGTLAVKPVFDIDFSLSLDGLEELTFSFGAGGGVTLELDATGAADFDREVPLLKVTFAPITFFVGPVPVVILPQMTFYVGAGGQVSAATTIRVAQQASLEVGLGYRDGEFGPISDSSSEFDFDVPTLAGQAGAKAYGGVRFALLLYGIGGPYAEAQGYLRADASLPRPDCVEWRLPVGLEANVGIDFLVEYEANVIDESTVLDESDGCEPPPPPPVYWARSYGGAISEQANSIRLTQDGGYVVVGKSLSFVSSTTSTWIVKLTGGGEITWQKVYTGIAVGTDVWQNDDGTYIVGGGHAGVTSDLAHLTKLDAAGNVLWSRSYKSSDNRGLVIHGLQPTGDNGYIVTGPLGSFTDGGDAWVAKLDGNGGVVWSKRYGGGGWDRSNAVRQAHGGGYIVAATTENTFGNEFADFWLLRLNEDGEIDWQKQYGGESDADGSDEAFDVEPIPGGGYYVGGPTTSFSGDLHDAWVIRIDNGGNVAWGTHCNAGSIADTVIGLAVADDDGVVVGGATGLYANERNAWVFKLNSAGNVAWSKAYGGPNAEEIGGISGYDGLGDPFQATLDGGFIFTGLSKSFAEPYHYWVVKITRTGAIEFDPASGAEVTNVTGSFIPTDDYRAQPTSAVAVDTPLVVADVTEEVVVAPTDVTFRQQAP